MDLQQREDLLRLRQLLDDPASTAIDIVECYMRLLSPQLQMLARDGYRRDGRGLIEIDLRDIDLRNTRGGLPIHYFPTEDYDDDWPQEAFELIRSYEPDHEIVVLVYHDSGPMLFILDQAAGPAGSG